MRREYVTSNPKASVNVLKVSDYLQIFPSTTENRNKEKYHHNPVFVSIQSVNFDFLDSARPSHFSHLFRMRAEE